MGKKRSQTTATVLQTMDAKLVSLTEHNTTKAREQFEHEEALNSTLKEVAERLREKQNASKRGAGGASGRKELRDDDGMDVDEPAGSETRAKNRKYVGSSFSRFSTEFIYFSEHHRRWSRRARSVTECDGLVVNYQLVHSNTVTLVSLFFAIALPSLCRVIPPKVYMSVVEKSIS